jgi:hydroxypyruvate reductase
MDNEQIEQARQQVLEIFDAGVNRVKGFNAVADYLTNNPMPDEYHMISVGKAGSSMALGALSVLKKRIVSGIVITKHEHIEDELRDYEHVLSMESDHPVPGEASIASGEALLNYIQQADQDAKFLVLFSGGASSLMEVLAEGMTLEKLAELNKVLLSIGYDITQMNQIRRAISHIKGGRLANYINNRETVSLCISDVPGDDPAVIGSGPLTPVDDDISSLQLPDAIASILEGVEFTPAPDEQLFEQVETHVIATLSDAKNAAAHTAERLGLPVVLHPEFMEGNAEEKARELCEYLIHAAEEGVHIWGGETSLILPSNPGRGGRNQHFAAVAATQLIGCENIVLLAAGTDGTDGPTPDAGGVVDASSVAKGAEQGCDITEYIETANVGEFLMRSGDLVTTGPTGTNVMDLVIAIKL